LNNIDESTSLPSAQDGAFIFDLDGTLVDSVPDITRAINLALKALKRPTCEEGDVRHWIGNGAKALVRRAVSSGFRPTIDVPQRLLEETHTQFLKYYSDTLCESSTLYPGVKETLAELKSIGYPLAIATNKPARFIAPICETLEINTFFSICVGGDSLPEKKPSPLPLAHLCHQLNKQAHHCIMVGDSKNDILAAKAAGMRSIGLTYGYNYGESISQYRPDWVFDDFSEITSLLP